MTLAPPRLPRPLADQRTFRQPPLRGMRSPASGFAAIQETNASRSRSDQIAAAYFTNTSVSATVRTPQYTAAPYMLQWKGHAPAKQPEGVHGVDKQLRKSRNIFPPVAFYQR